MRTHLDCIPCFFKQALEAARTAGASEKIQKIIVNELAESILYFPMTTPPPEMGRVIYRLVTKHTGIHDPYIEIKNKSNKLGLSNYKKLCEKLDKSRDRLLTAVTLAIAGNVIDYGVKNRLNVERELDKILDWKGKMVQWKNNPFFDYSRFRSVLDKTKSILYLADNAGETVFDRILIEEIKRMDSRKKIYYAVKEKPIINDALIADAYTCGIDKSAEIISSGSDGPGTILSVCSTEFLNIFQEVDLIISKGQGNFEQLSSVPLPIYFLLISKCPVVAMEIGCKVGELLLLSSHRQSQILH